MFEFERRGFDERGGKRWVGDNGAWHNALDRSNEAIAFSGNGAEKARIFGIVFEGLAGFADSGVDAVVGVNEDIFAPDGQENFLSGDEAVALLGEQEEQLEWNAFEFDETAGAAQLEGA